MKGGGGVEGGGQRTRGILWGHTLIQGVVLSGSLKLLLRCL